MTDIGDVAVLRMTLRDPDTGLLADTDTVTVTILSPDGAVSAPVNADHPSIGIYTHELAITAAGTWRYEFKATGTIQADESGVFVVKPLWAAPVAWSPTLQDVAAYVPARTHATADAGDQGPQGTFTVDTIPDDQQAAALIAASTAHVAARLGAVADPLFDAAKAVAAIRAAGFVELAYPATDDDVNTAKTLLDEATRMLTDLLTANAAAGGGSAGDSSHLLPVFSFPEPRPNLDTYPTY